MSQGRLIPAVKDSSLTRDDIKKIQLSIISSKSEKIIVVVASKNDLKVEAACLGVKSFLAELDIVTPISPSGIDVESGIDEQPVGEDVTRKGSLTRLANLEKAHPLDKQKPTFLISLENGLIPETIAGMSDVYRDAGDITWVDRCILTGKYIFRDLCIQFECISEGVTTPKEEVHQARLTNWTKTAGSFIGVKYNCNPKDWHAVFTGKTRREIMCELVKSAFRLPFKFTPVLTGVFKPDVYHTYTNSDMVFFTSKEISEFLQIERKRKMTDAEKDDSVAWRSVYALIDQPKKLEDGKPINSSGVILTEDLLVTFFMRVGDQDVLHVVLLWPKDDPEIKEYGWTLPGKRDRAYDKKQGDIAVEDANYSLVEKEIGVARTSVLYHFILGYFDDRKREQRMKSSGFVSLVLLKDSPVLIPGKIIAVPLNMLIALCKREIKISNYSMARNHDSLLLAIFETSKFYRTLENLKQNQVKWRAMGSGDIRPDIAIYDPGFECDICCDILIKPMIICSNGHTVCGLCSRTLTRCPYCKKNVTSKIHNLNLEDIVKTRYPKAYIEKMNTLGEKTITWQEDPFFCGTAALLLN